MRSALQVWAKFHLQCWKITSSSIKGPGMLCYSISLFKRHMVVIAFLSNDTSLLSCPQWIIERETDRERFVNKQLVLSFLLSEKSGEIARDSSRYFYNESHVSFLSFMCTQGFFLKKNLLFDSLHMDPIRVQTHLNTRCCSEKIRQPRCKVSFPALHFHAVFISLSFCPWPSWNLGRENRQENSFTSGVRNVIKE